MSTHIGSWLTAGIPVAGGTARNGSRAIRDWPLLPRGGCACVNVPTRWGHPFPFLDLDIPSVVGSMGFPLFPPLGSEPLTCTTNLLHGRGEGRIPFFDFEGSPVLVKLGPSVFPRKREGRPARANARAVPGLGQVACDASGRGEDRFAPPFSAGVYSEAEVTLTS
jgi:hypothetical protein